jgi:CHAT domain-containing protein
MGLRQLGDRPRPQPDADRQVLAVGKNSFQDHPSETALPNLADAERCAQSVAGQFGDTALYGAAATEQRVRAELGRLAAAFCEASQPNFVFFLTHAHVVPDSPEKSCLFLTRPSATTRVGWDSVPTLSMVGMESQPGRRTSQPPTTFNDGRLTLPEIYRLNLHGCELAVLAACNTNVGSSRGGTLSRAFLQSGARRVMASQWSVAAPSTARLMEEVFKEIAEQRNESQTCNYGLALHRARERIRSAGGNWDLPYFWAPFVLVGPPVDPGQ